MKKEFDRSAAHKAADLKAKEAAAEAVAGLELTRKRHKLYWDIYWKTYKKEFVRIYNEQKGGARDGSAQSGFRRH